MKAVGIILAGGNNSRMQELSNKRAIAAMPIGGSFRSIDFALSNMSNSHVHTVAVLTQYSARSLNEHLSSSKWWDFGRKQGGTLASPNPLMLDYSLPKNDEIRIALSDVGIPFRDYSLDETSDAILERRTEERHLARHNTKISSAVKTPIFLGSEMDDEKLKRRVERNLAKMNIPSTTSDEAFYIIECENDYSKNQDEKNNSRNRILDMEKKLKKVKTGNYGAT